jgi:hypothetical protein
MLYKLMYLLNFSIAKVLFCRRVPIYWLLMNLSHVTFLSDWSTVPGAELRRFTHPGFLTSSAPLWDTNGTSRHAAEARRFWIGLGLSKGGGSCSRQRETFSGLIETL